MKVGDDVMTSAEYVEQMIEGIRTQLDEIPARLAREAEPILITPLVDLRNGLQSLASLVAQIDAGAVPPSDALLDAVRRIL